MIESQEKCSSIVLNRKRYPNLANNSTARLNLIFIGILSFGDTQNPYFISRHKISDAVTGKKLLKDFEFIHPQCVTGRKVNF